MTATDLRTVPWPPPAPIQRAGDPVHRHRRTPPAHSPVRHTASPTPTSSHVFGLIPLRVFLAVGWIRAGVEKLVDRHWWNGDRLRAFVGANRSVAVPPFRPFLDHVAVPLAVAVSFVVLAAEIACGIAVGVGRPLRAALRWGVFLNVVFMLSGPVNPSVFYLVMEIVLLLAVAEGTIGVRPSRPGPRTLAGAAVLLASAGVLAPYVRTLEPAKVIADPALTLLFLALLTCATLVARFALAPPPDQSFETEDSWVWRLMTWAKASPERSTTSRSRPTATMPHVVSAIGWGRRR